VTATGTASLRGARLPAPPCRSRLHSQPRSWLRPQLCVMPRASEQGVRTSPPAAPRPGSALNVPAPGSAAVLPAATRKAKPCRRAAPKAQPRPRHAPPRWKPAGPAAPALRHGSVIPGHGRPLAPVSGAGSARPHLPAPASSPAVPWLSLAQGKVVYRALCPLPPARAPAPCPGWWARGGRLLPARPAQHPQGMMQKNLPIS